MPASEARIAANRANSLKSTGPVTQAGKEKSRSNSLKHGLTGAGVVQPEKDAAGVERKAAAYAQELNADGEVGRDLTRRAALNAVRMDRAADQQAAALAERVRKVEAEFVAPEGATAEGAARLRSEAVRAAMFDPSPEAALARKYEAAAERAYFRCLKELQRREKSARSEAKGDAEAQAQAMLGSILQRVEAERTSDEEMDAWFAEQGMSLPELPPQSFHLAPLGGGFDLPFSIGKGR